MGMMNEFTVLDPNGHTTTMWDPQDEKEVERARRIFDEMRRRGYRAFRVGKDGSPGQPRNTFDARDDAMLFVPPIHAG
jgi:hypothetical protein